MTECLYLLISHFYKMVLMQIVISFIHHLQMFSLCLVSNGYSEIAITIDLFQLIFRSVIFLKSLGKLQVSQTEMICYFQMCCCKCGFPSFLNFSQGYIVPDCSTFGIEVELHT